MGAMHCGSEWCVVYMCAAWDTVKLWVTEKDEIVKSYKELVSI